MCGEEKGRRIGVAGLAQLGPKGGLHKQTQQLMFMGFSHLDIGDGDSLMSMRVASMRRRINQQRKRNQGTLILCYGSNAKPTM